jgi:predicted AAA+ superfamily ATPase
MPLSFNEFKEVKNNSNDIVVYNDYLQIGGLGIIIQNIDNHENIFRDLKIVFNDTIFKDVKYRHHNKENVLIDKLIKYVYATVGRVLSTENIQNYLSSKKDSFAVNKKTIGNYLN